MKLLVLTTSYPSGPDDYRGRFVHDVSAALARRGHGVTVLTPHPGGQACHCEAMDGVAVSRLSSLVASWSGLPTLFGRHGVVETLRREPWRVAEVAPAMARLAARAARQAIDFDMIISHWALPCGWLGAELSRLVDIPHVIVEHGGGIRLLNSLPGGRLAASRILGGTALLHCASHRIAEALLELLPPGQRSDMAARTVVQPMPAGHGEVTPTVARLYRLPRRVLFVGRFVPGKGVNHLLHSLAGTESLRLTMVGDGPGLRQAMDFVGAAGLEARVDFLGEVGTDALPTVFAGHDVLVVPSAPHRGGRADLLEGVPRVLLQGMAAGLVPVVTEVGGMPGVVHSERCGLVVPPGDPTALGEALMRLEQDVGLCRRFARQARRTVLELSMDNLLARWVAALPGLAGAAGVAQREGVCYPERP
jgi:phosphatidyl-myo-inositol dimannoside synthase